MESSNLGVVNPRHIASQRRSFRRILTTRLGITLAFSLALVASAVFVLAIVWTNYQALVPLRAEAEHVAELVGESGSLETERYDWSEPHHRFATERIDPFFLQVFDASGRPARSSENIGTLEAPYPARLLASSDPGKRASREASWVDHVFARPVRFSVGRDRFYGYVHPIVSAGGAIIGAVQVARFDFGQEAAIRRLGVGLLVGFVVVLLLMLTMLWASSRRVLRPLETLTHAVATLDTGQIASVIAVPPNADSETARLAETINASLLRIDRSFEEVRRFTADAAHELLTPIAILKGHIEVALRRERSANDYKDTLRTLIEEVDSMAGLVRALLTLARLDESVGTDEPTGLVDIDAVLSDEVAAVRSSASARGVRVDLSAVSGEVSGEVSGNRVIGHPQLIREAVRNILDNAIKYTENGTVGIHAVRNNGRVTISVDDTGRGIRTDELPMLTERFFRARDVQDLPGHGLGLALVSAIAKRHGGRLSIAQRKEGGTHVELSLPASVEPLS